jgi:hypothetical protein
MNMSRIDLIAKRCSGLLRLPHLFFLAVLVGQSPTTQGAGTTAPSANATNDLWSVQRLVRPEVPAVRDAHARVRNPIDQFILAKLAGKGLHPSPEAERRTLIRRLFFDLTGLPPTPGEVDSFVNDPAPDAYEKWVDRLLASPRYGERWARHWLDVVHYGETHGYDKDKPRPNAWPYRDYVIRAFNEDRPYARFIQEQVAGDVLFPFMRDGIEALGFVAAGPWDFIGHAEVPETKIDGRVARHLDRDDMVVNTIQTFNSLTVQCAQCHNHKFDPISQEDYYSLQAVFAAVDRTDREYDIDPAIGRMRAGLKEREQALIARREKIDTAIIARAGEPLTALDAKITEADKAARKGDAFGYHSGIEARQDAAKWVQIDLGRVLTLTNIVLHPCKDDFNNIGEGFGFPVRFKVEVANDAEFTGGVATVADRTMADVENPKLKALAFNAGGRTARFIRVTATKLAPRQNDFIFALAELRAFDAAGVNVALGASVSALDSTEAPVRWQKSNLTDGWYPGVGSAESTELVRLRAERDTLIASTTSPAEKQELENIRTALGKAKEELTRLPKPGVAYVAAVHSGSGAFAGTGKSGGKPRPIHILNRGNVQKPGEETGPGTLHALSDLPARFEIPPEQPEGERRAALARWLSDERNPLTWRSIVNRVWQQHFGRGIVETPNDFGRMGGVPTHPELLDWLACEFRDGGQSLKKLHRLMVTSATYRQVSEVVREDGEKKHSVASGQPSVSSDGHRPLNAAAPTTDHSSTADVTDSDNRHLWRMNRRKLDAESLRDAMLFVAGKMDFTMGGPSFQDFVVEKPEHSPHYEYYLHDPEDPKSHRRSIYRFIVRSQPQPFMTTLDCADPSMQVARRNESVTALQALAMLNNAMVVSMSKHFAAKLDAQSGGLRDKVRLAHYDAVGRPPSDAELDKLAHYSEEFGTTNLCRVLFNLNEFSFVD